MLFSSKIDDYFGKTLNYLPYKYSIFFQKPLLYSKKDIQANNSNSKKLYYFVSSTEKKSALDYHYWEFKMLHQINNKSSKREFEKNFINLAILSKNNENKKKLIRLYYLRNVPRFSREVADIITSK